MMRAQPGLRTTRGSVAQSHLMEKFLKSLRGSDGMTCNATLKTDIYKDRDRLFETHPECKDVFFLFRDVEDLDRLRTSRELRAHGLRVMSFIEKSVARLEQLERLEVLAVELGRSHYRSNAPPKYYSYVGAEFICAVQPILKERWTPELEEAWKTLFLYLTRLMNRGYQEERTRHQQVGASPKERNSLIRDLAGLNSRDG